MFSDQKVTILQGNGFYFKYIPGAKDGNSILGDDKYIFTTIPNKYFVSVYAFFTRDNSDKANTALTGQTYVFTNSPSPFSVTLKKSWYPFKIASIKLKIDGKDSPKSPTQSNGYFTIS
jgi:hypothetical protein